MEIDEPPLVSIVMPVYNSEQYLSEAIESVLNQTYRKFEFIIIDDGSTDDSLSIIESYYDPRIVVLKNEKNRGIVYSLNKGVDRAKGQFIARMDADDVSLPQRFEKQVEFLENNPDFDLVGCRSDVIDETSRQLFVPKEYYTENESIQIKLLFNSPILHPGVMMRKAVFNNFSYDKCFNPAEDYYLWTQMALHGCKFYNLPEILFHYRRHTSNMSTVKKLQKTRAVRTVHKIQLEHFEIEYSEEDLTTHGMIAKYSDIQNLNTKILLRVYNWLKKLLKHNQEKKQFDSVLFLQIIDDHWYFVCHEAAKRGLSSSLKLYYPNRFASVSKSKRRLFYLYLIFIYYSMKRLV